MPRKRKKSRFFETVKLIFKALRFLLLFLLKSLFGLIAFFFRKAKKVPLSKSTAKPLYRAFTEVETISGNLWEFKAKIMKNKSTVGIILGARGSGKTAFGMRLLENVYSKTKRKCCAIGFRKEDLPGWIKAADDIKQIPNGSFVLIDEGGILFSSRQSMKNANKMLSELLLISRHKDLSIGFITQNSSNIEINTIRMADYLVLKPSSLLQIDFEREKIRDIYSEINDKYEKHKKTKGMAYIYSDDFRGFITASLPGFWEERLSKSFRDK